MPTLILILVIILGIVVMVPEVVEVKEDCNPKPETSEVTSWN